MSHRFVIAARIALSVLALAVIAVAGQAGQRWPHG
jgi:hypothetical protein